MIAAIVTDNVQINKDPTTKLHRLHARSIKGGSSKSSKYASNIVLASIHCDDPTDAQMIRDGLVESFGTGGALVVV